MTFLVHTTENLFASLLHLLSQQALEIHRLPLSELQMFIPPAGAYHDIRNFEDVRYIQSQECLFDVRFGAD